MVVDKSWRAGGFGERGCIILDYSGSKRVAEGAL
jgi:hypothetical protein